MDLLGGLWMFWLGLPLYAAYSHFASMAYVIASSQVLNSAGDRDLIAEGKLAKWVDVGMQVEG